MSKSQKSNNNRFKEIIKICQDALKGKTKLEDTDLLSVLPKLRSEIQKGQYNFSSIKAFSLSSQVLDLKTRNLLEEFIQGAPTSENLLIDKLLDENALESILIHPINTFRHYIFENEIIDAYIELLKIRKIQPDYSGFDREELCIEGKNEFKEVDSFEKDKLYFLRKLNQLNKKVINFNSLQAQWEEAVTNLLYLAHLAQEGRVTLKQKTPEGQIIIQLKN